MCLIQGPGGVGKRTLAAALGASTGRKIAWANFPESGADPIDDLMLRISAALAVFGQTGLSEAIGRAEDSFAALVAMLQHPVLLVIDNFERAASPALVSGSEADRLSDILQQLLLLGNVPGRLLLLAQAPGAVGRTAYALSRAPVRTLGGLERDEAEALWLDLRSPTEGPVAPSQTWPLLDGNPRALRTFAKCRREVLSSAELETQILRGQSPPARHSAELEQHLLSLSLPQPEGPAWALLERLCVYRDIAPREALGERGAEDELGDRNLLWPEPSGQVRLHPLVSSLIQEWLPPAALRVAHESAAELYRRLADHNPHRACGLMVEARHHLIAAGREQELRTVLRPLLPHLTHLYARFQDPQILIPEESAVLDERIAVLAAIIDSSGTPGLHGCLARWLTRRDRPGDRERALAHARIATGPSAPASAWATRVLLEGLDRGPEAARQTAMEGARWVSPTRNQFALQASRAEVLIRLGQTDAALAILREGLARAPRDKGLTPKYRLASHLLSQVGALEDALCLLREGLQVVPKDQVLLYKDLIGGLLDAGRIDHSLQALEECQGRLPRERGLQALWRRCATHLRRAGRVDEAIRLLVRRIEAGPKDRDLVPLYEDLAAILVAGGDLPRAIATLRDGFAEIRFDKREPVQMQGRDPFKRNPNPGRRQRYHLVQTALCLCAAARDEEAMRSILAGTGGAAVPVMEQALGQVLLLQLEGDYPAAAQAAEHGRKHSPFYFALAAQEAFSWLCAGAPERAREALRSFPGGFELGLGQARAWLAALIALRVRDPQEARQAWAAYLGRPLALDEDLTEAALLQAWDSDGGRPGGGDPAFFFPSMPPRLTGLPEMITRPPYGPPVLPRFD